MALSVDIGSNSVSRREFIGQGWEVRTVPPSAKDVATKTMMLDVNKHKSRIIVTIHLTFERHGFAGTSRDGGTDEERGP